VTPAVCSLPIQFPESVSFHFWRRRAARIDHATVGHCIVRSRLNQSRSPAERCRCVTQRGDHMAAMVLAVAPGMLYFHASRQWIELMPTRTPLTVRECLGPSGIHHCSAMSKEIVLTQIVVDRTGQDRQGRIQKIALGPVQIAARSGCSAAPTAGRHRISTPTGQARVRTRLPDLERSNLCLGGRAAQCSSL